jgi:hypothetical protein
MSTHIASLIAGAVPRLVAQGAAAIAVESGPVIARPPGSAWSGKILVRSEARDARAKAEALRKSPFPEHGGDEVLPP